MLSLILPILIGSGLGAVVGYFGQCSSGTCPLTSTWWRGALYGAAMGLIFGLVSPRGNSAGLNESTTNVKKITEADFEAAVSKSATPVVVDFYATWCGPCRVLSPQLDKVAGQFSGKIKFLKVDVDEAQSLAGKYKISGVPTLLFFAHGQVVDTVVGLVSTDELKERLDALAAKGQGQMANLN